MKTIIKYKNRKLYDKDNHSYLSLVDILSMPTGSFTVIDRETGAEITQSVLLSALLNVNTKSETRVKVLTDCLDLEKKWSNTDMEGYLS